MLMIPWDKILIGGVTVAYLLTSFFYLSKGNYPLGIVFSGYSLANVGLLYVKS